jgi:cysteine desulfurase
MSRIYLDHHATTPVDPSVIEAMLPYFGERFGNANARTNARGREAARTLEQVRAQVAGLAAAPAESVHLTPGASAANRQVFEMFDREGARDEICVSAIEHPSVLDAARASGLSIRMIPASADGFISPDALRTVCGPRTAVVSVLAASHELGTLQPIEALAAIAHGHGARFHCDATQAAGKVEVFWGSADLITLSAHKLYGPQGMGALIARDRSLPVPSRWGTPPLALAVGFGAACALALEAIDHDAHRLRALTDRFLNALGPHLLNGAASPRLPGSLNLRFPGCDAEEILLACNDTLELSTGAACGSARRAPSPVLRAIGLSDVEIASSVRLSFGRFNTEDEATRAGSILRGVIAAHSLPSRH